MNVYLEIFGYFGTALVIVSMMMTSMLKFRIINMCGGTISLVYAILVNAWSVVVVNASLVIINLIQAIKEITTRGDYHAVKVSYDDAMLNYFISLYKSDIEKELGALDSCISADNSVHIIFNKGEAMGISATKEMGEAPSIYLIKGRSSKGAQDYIASKIISFAL